MTDANLAANLKQEVLTAIDHWERNTGSMDFLLCDYLVPVVAKMIHDRTAALEAENAKLRAAIQVFADEAYKHDPDEYDGDDLVWDCDLKIGDLRRAGRSDRRNRMTLELHTTGLELAGITLALAYKDRPYSNQNAAASAIRAYLAATDSVIMPMALSPELCAIGDDVLSDIVDEQTNSFGETSAVVKSGYAQRIHAALVTAVERGKR